eukprot:769272_1
MLFNTALDPLKQQLRSISSNYDNRGIITLEGMEAYIQQNEQIGSYLILSTLVIATVHVLQFFQNGFSLERIRFVLYNSIKGTKKMQSKLQETENTLRDSLVGSIADIVNKYPKNTKLSNICAQKKDELISTVTKWAQYETRQWNGTDMYCSGALYIGDDALVDLQNKTYSLFCLSNPLHATTFPFMVKMKAEVIAMTISLFHGHVDDGHCGLVTTGGTESLILAVRAYKNYGKKVKNIQRPELIVPVTAHAAFDKACDMMDIKLIKVKVDSKTYCVKSSAMEKYITPNTIAIVGSTPQYSHGTMDPIADLAALAQKYDIGCHVDCCLGSFVVPLLKMIGYQIPSFDFELDGVTSISCDTHKYGMCPKGTSVLMFKNKDYRKHAYFIHTDVLQGLYATPTILGSRGGGVIAAAWCTMMYLGKKGYVAAAEEIMAAVDSVKHEVHQHDKIEIMGNPISSVVAFRFKKSLKHLEIFAVADAMHKHGWELAKCQKPNCIHFAFTMQTCGEVERFIGDFLESVEDVHQCPHKYKKSSGAMYGAVVNLPSTHLQDDILTMWLDILSECRGSIDVQRAQNKHFRRYSRAQHS